MKRLLFALFTLSGFSGLIYESIWSHYLKLFLGHAAYAQTLVLAIFMGGMALGAWACGRFSTRWKNLLAAYALAELLIGIAALGFHPLFDGFLQWAYTTLMPAIGTPTGVQLFKWSAATLLILPQSILLGMTFPLMSAAVIRRFPEAPGGTVAMLYFTNSVGAAVGVLVSGFVLIDAVGLPGTIRAAGAINIVLALVVWQLARGRDEPAFAVTAAGQANTQPHRLFLIIALLTGAASFIYEIAWIRMLSLVLGSSTHAFELMLSAFILGLALGGLWIKRRIDRVADSVRTLAIVQVVMGLLALTTLPLYNHSFEVMQWILAQVPRTDAGYAWFNLGSHAIAAAIMLPAAICAGMTLPLITTTLIQRGHGERSIGQVYAANTVGAIAGVFFATHLGLPLLGLKNLLTVGAALDISLGLFLLWRLMQPRHVGAASGRDLFLPGEATEISRPEAAPTKAAPTVIWGARLVTVAGVSAVLLVFALVTLDPYKMASGVYRHGQLFTPELVDLLFHRDGKTATVDLTRLKSNQEVTISTNGKPDASINMAGGAPSPDESTMALIAALPLAMHARAQSAAVIGMGSGLTTHVLATAPQLQTIDTIEIEQAMVDAARGFRPRVEAAFANSASRIHIDDAKTFFSTHNTAYDIIISEPSNPWVSGVASLYTQEFYRLTKRFLNPDGLFVQWLQIYELDLNMVATVFKAIVREFPGYRVYAANDEDLVIVASPTGDVPELDYNLFAAPFMRGELQRYGIHSLDDLRLHYIGDQRLLAPLFENVPIELNSDYFPVLDLHAARTRFLQRSAGDLMRLRALPVPLAQMLGHDSPPPAVTRVSPSPYLAVANEAYAATLLRDFLLENRAGPDYFRLDERIKRAALYFKTAALDCTSTLPAEAWIRHLAELSIALTPWLSVDETTALWDRIAAAPCAQALNPAQRGWLALVRAIAQRDAAEIARVAPALLSNTEAMDDMTRALLVYATVAAHLARGERDLANNVWQQQRPALFPDQTLDIYALLIEGHLQPAR